MGKVKNYFCELSGIRRNCALQERALFKKHRFSREFDFARQIKMNPSMQNQIKIWKTFILI